MSVPKRSQPILSRFHIPRGNLILAGFILLGTLIGIPGTALARAHVRPTLFALAPTVFPAGSQIVRAGVETNGQLLMDRPLHFGLPPAALGRLSGYYMDAEEGGPVAGTHAYTSYLVSIFRSRREAHSVFDALWDTWFAATYYTSPGSVGIALGDNGDEALFHTLDLHQPRFEELFFRRGAVLVEVFQGTSSASTTEEEMRSVYVIATGLDELARTHPHGV
jgi:hypothetical protein